MHLGMALVDHDTTTSHADAYGSELSVAVYYIGVLAVKAEVLK